MPSRGDEPALSSYIQRRLSGRAEPLEAFLATVAAPEEVRQQVEMLERVGAFAAGTASTADVELPGELDDFELVSRLGQGGMATVFEAFQRSLRRRVALKIIASPRRLDERFRARFEHEALTLARLQHRHIVRVYGSGVASSFPYIVMELVEGEALDLRVPADADAATSSHAKEMVRLGARVARALAHCHENGVVHRDVKPGNILVRGDGEPILVDFGLAQDDSRDTLTLSGEFMGTLSYIAPEQALGGDVDQRVDVYGLGASLCHLLTGSTPYEARTAGELVALLQQEEPRSPRSLNPSLSRDVATILARATARDRRDRYASCADLADDLEAFLDGRPIRARTVGPVTRGVRWARRRPAQATLTLVTLLLLVVAPLAAYQKWQMMQAAAQERFYEDLAAAIDEQDADEKCRLLTTLRIEHPDEANVWMLSILAELRSAVRFPLPELIGQPQEIDRLRRLLDSAPVPIRSEAFAKVIHDALSAVGEHDLERARRTDFAVPEPTEAGARIRYLNVLCGLLGRTEGLAEKVEEVIDARPQDIVIQLIGSGVAFLGSYYEASDLRLSAAALRSASALVALRPTPSARLRLAYTKYQMAGFLPAESRAAERRRALQRVEAILKSVPTGSSLWINFAVFVAEMQEDFCEDWHERVVSIYEAVIDSHPDQDVARKNLRNALFLRYRQVSHPLTDEQRQALCRIVELSDEIKDAYGRNDSNVWRTAAWCLDKLGRADEISGWLREGIETTNDGTRFSLCSLQVDWGAEIKDPDRRDAVAWDALQVVLDGTRPGPGESWRPLVMAFMQRYKQSTLPGRFLSELAASGFARSEWPPELFLLEAFDRRQNLPGAERSEKVWESARGALAAGLEDPEFLTILAHTARGEKRADWQQELAAHLAALEERGVDVPAELFALVR